MSDFAAAEVAATISKFVRMRRFSSDTGNKLLAAFDAWMATHAVRVSITSYDVEEANRLVRRFELVLRPPDALHLALAVRHGATLVTRDLAMARAAETRGIPMEPLPA